MGRRHNRAARRGTPATRWVGLLALLVTARPPDRLTAQDVVLATTTSTRDAGLLDSLLPAFEQRTGRRVRVIAVGSGQALAMGRRGDADVVLSHSPAAERALADSGYFTRRLRVMHNEFLVVGPARDPAAVRGMNDVVAAFRRLAGASFVSRGDRSGTHQMELGLWRLAAVTPPGPGAWYVEAGQGMGETLQMADEKGAYTLVDRATYLVWRDRVALVPMVEGDSLLRNVYHVLVANPRNARRVNHAGGDALADFLVSAETQAKIGAFGRSRFGQTLFVPNQKRRGGGCTRDYR
jgi:tungstate transport system substrate-binding protein